MQRLKSIKRDGEIYFDTGYQISPSTTKVILRDFYAFGPSTGYKHWCYLGSSNLWRFEATTTSLALKFNDIDQNFTGYWATEIDVSEMIITPTSATLDGVETLTYNVNFPTTDNIFLFALNSNGDDLLTPYKACKMGAIEFWEGETLMAHIVPFEDNGEVFYKDIISNTICPKYGAGYLKISEIYEAVTWEKSKITFPATPTESIKVYYTTEVPITTITLEDTSNAFSYIQGTDANGEYYEFIATTNDGEKRSATATLTNEYGNATLQIVQKKASNGAIPLRLGGMEIYDLYIGNNSILAGYYMGGLVYSKGPTAPRFKGVPKSIALSQQSPTKSLTITCDSTWSLVNSNENFIISNVTESGFEVGVSDTIPNGEIGTITISATNDIGTTTKTINLTYYDIHFVNYIENGHYNTPQLNPINSHMINLDYRPNDNTKFKFKVNIAKGIGNFFLGNYMQGNWWRMFFYYWNTSADILVDYKVEMGYRTTVSLGSWGTDVIIECTKNRITIGDTYKTNSLTTLGEVERCYLYGIPQNDNKEYSNAKLYWLEIYENDVLVRKYLPALLGDVAVLYEEVESKYYYNEGPQALTWG